MYFKPNASSCLLLMSISRREFIYLLGGTGLGLATGNTDRLAEKVWPISNRVDFRVQQTKEYFQWLRVNDAIDRFQIKEKPVLWNEKEALVAINEESKIELVIPYKPEVKYLEVIGVSGEIKEESAIRFVMVRAELPNIENGAVSSGWEFYSTNVFEANRLSELPPAEWGFPPETALTTNVSSTDVNLSALEGLRFQIVFNWAMVADTIPFVSNEAVFESDNKLGSWSAQIARFNLQEIVSKESYLRPEDISEINVVGLSKDGQRAFNYYLV